MPTIVPSSFPCRHPEICKSRAEGQQQLREKTNLFKKMLAYRPLSITAEDEVLEQIFSLGFAYKDIVERIKNPTSIVVEWIEGTSRFTDLPVTICPSTLFIVTRVETRSPLHIICGYMPRPHSGKNWELPILGIYNPSPYREKWRENFTRRLCFCDEEDATVEEQKATISWATPYARTRREHKDRLKQVK